LKYDTGAGFAYKTYKTIDNEDEQFDIPVLQEKEKV